MSSPNLNFANISISHSPANPLPPAIPSESPHPRYSPVKYPPPPLPANHHPLPPPAYSKPVLPTANPFPSLSQLTPNPCLPTPTPSPAPQLTPLPLPPPDVAERPSKTIPPDGTTFKMVELGERLEYTIPPYGYWNMQFYQVRSWTGTTLIWCKKN